MSLTLQEFIQSNPDPRELKRAIAVQMSLQGLKHYQIQDALGVSSGFISKWTQRYAQQGVLSLKLAHQGSRGYLTPQQRQAILDWLSQRDSWNLCELQDHIQEEYGVKFQSKQSYYDLFHQAGMSWKKTQKHNPKTDPELVQKKRRADAMAGKPSLRHRVR